MREKKNNNFSSVSCILIFFNLEEEGSLTLVMGKCIDGFH